MIAFDVGSDRLAPPDEPPCAECEHRAAIAKHEGKAGFIICMACSIKRMVKAQGWPTEKHTHIRNLPDVRPTGEAVTVDRIGWYLLWFLAGLGFVFGIAGVAHCKPPTLRETIIAAAPGLGSRSEQTVPPDVLADAVLAATSNRKWVALLLTIASHESALSARIARGECRPKECDAGRAWGLGQVHRVPRNAAFWGSPDINVQLREISHVARGYFDMCKTSGVPFPLSTLRGYAGRGCTGALKGEAERVATYERLLRRL